MKLSKFCNKISLILQALWCAVLYFIIEALCRHSVADAWNYMTGKPLVFAYNTAFIFTTMLIVYLFHRRVFWRVVVSVFWLFLGIVNCILLLNRVTPFTGPDLHMLTDGIAIMQKYLPFYGVVIGCIIIGLVLFALLILFIKGPKYQQKIKYRYVIPMIVVGAVAFGGITQLALEKRVLSNYFGNIAFAYEDYGYPYCLATTIFNTGISQPRDYSEEEIKRIEKTESNLPETKEDGKRPNILFLQLESFFDPTLVNYLNISEDPILTGRICAAQVKAMAKSGIGSTIKHFCGNNQEVGRSTSDSVISERALREIYLKGFEIAVKEGGARSVMTTYGSVNGLWTAGSYDLCTTILRKEWGFDGIVMTDWWAKSNYEGHQAEVPVKAPMVAAQNDIYMVVSDAKANPENDDVEEMLHAGKITLGELQRNAANILGFLLKSPSILLLADRICEEELEAMNTKEEDDVDAGSLVNIESDPQTQEIVIDGALLHPAKGNADVLAVTNDFMGDFTMKFTLKSDLGELAQLPVSVFLDNIHKMTVSVQGTNGKWVEESRILNMGFGHNHYIKLYYGADNLEIEKIVLTPNR